MLDQWRFYIIIVFTAPRSSSLVQDARFSSWKSWVQIPYAVQSYGFCGLLKFVFFRELRTLSDDGANPIRGTNISSMACQNLCFAANCEPCRMTGQIPYAVQ